MALPSVGAVCEGPYLLNPGAMGAPRNFECIGDSENDDLVSSSMRDLVVGQVHLRSYMGHPNI